jgi:hypothetical protein
MSSKNTVDQILKQKREGFIQDYEALCEKYDMELAFETRAIIRPRAKAKPQDLQKAKELIEKLLQKKQEKTKEEPKKEAK